MVKFILQRHIDKLKKFEAQRSDWLKFSVVVAVSLSLIIVDIFFIAEKNLTYILVGAGLLISAAWWYWTMHIVREVLNHKHYEAEILKMIIEDVKEIKQAIKSDNNELTS